MAQDRIEKRLAQRQLAYKKRKATLRKLYKYAKSKGFTPEMASVLSFETKEIIDLEAEKGDQC